MKPNLIFRAFESEVLDYTHDEWERVLDFVGSTSALDRYGDIIELKGWQVEPFMRSGGPFIWAHKYDLLPLGNALKVWPEQNRGLIFRVRFAPHHINPFADNVLKAYQAGLLRATSVGFRDLESEPILDMEGRQTGWHFLKQELYELSAVPVPANVDALALAVQKGFFTSEQVESFARSIQDWQRRLPGKPYEIEGRERGVIPYKAFPTDPPDAAWDGPAEIKAADIDDLKIICSWVDSEKPDAKGSYKLPHHRAKGYRTVWKGTAAAMAALLGARGGVAIPEGDRKGVYNHLAKHYAQFDKEPPEFKAVGEYTSLDLRLIEMGLPPMNEDLQEQILTLNVKVEGIRDEVRQAVADMFIPKASPEIREQWLKALAQMQETLGRMALGLLFQGLNIQEGADNPLYRLLLQPGGEPEGKLGSDFKAAQSAIKKILDKTKPPQH